MRRLKKRNRRWLARNQPVLSDKKEEERIIKTNMVMTKPVMYDSLSRHALKQFLLKW